ncbi:MAG: pantoate--beta-alanine ligase [Candidatus Eremiobacteraeota bacterium]|nr:pantoate--beta-alanine ligase [Candidatus Eremiobacteraeota bacterium]
MHVARTAESARSIARALPHPLGFVPTMGALHGGHLRLVERAGAENAAVAASIFVNPLQFGPHEDFARYPRAFDRDCETFERAGVSLVYAPSVEAMYPPRFSTSVNPGAVANRLEGVFRPGHFTGVATVVLKLVHAIEPATVYLGQKDAQQAAVLRAIAKDLDLAVSIVVVPTVREDDGLALSSRNAYLSPEQRAAAPSLHRALAHIACAVASGERNVANLLVQARGLLASPLAWEYLEIVDPQTFEPAAGFEAPALAVAAVRAGPTRLLDNEPIVWSAN